MNYMDLEDHNRVKRYDINGQEDSVEYELGFDDQPPRHCYESSRTCPEEPLTTPDFTDEVMICFLICVAFEETLSQMRAANTCTPVSLCICTVIRILPYT